MSGLGGIDAKDPPDLKEKDKPTAVAHVASLLGRAMRLHLRAGGGVHVPKPSQSLLAHVFVLLGTRPSQGQTIGGQQTSKEETQKST